MALQGKPVLKQFDIVAVTGGYRRGIVKEFNHVLVKGELEIKMAQAKGKRYGPVLSGVEMILEENTPGRR